jgi:mannosyl-oligosaccharide alpha-1,2-mannosidase
MPVWKWQSNDTIDEPHTQISRAELERFNFWTLKRDYFLRPGFPPNRKPFLQIETIESYFYAYRLTGKTIYQDRAWTAFQHISAATRAPYGYSSIKDVTTPGGWYQNDEQESYWFSETLKYLYLIFDDPSRLSLDKWVFNTEGHPLRRGRKVDW